MALPTPANRWMSEFDRPFRWLENTFDAFDDYSLYEEEDQFVLTIEVPGYDREEISVAWDDGVLNVAAEHVDEERGREQTYHRRFRFPRDVDEDSIEATYRNGVLEVVLPLEPGTTVRGVEIPVEG